MATKKDIRPLIERCKQNDRRAQEEIYRMFFPKMFGMCMKYLKEEDRAIEVLNDGFLRAFQKVETFGFNGSFEGWIRRIVYRCIMDHFKRHSKYRENVLLEVHEKYNEESALDKLYSEDLLSLVHSLPPKTQSVFCLFALEGYSHKEIADQLNISVGTSKWLLFNARERMQLLVKQQGLSL